MIKRILIVDEDESVRTSVKKVLEQAGYEVDLAASAQEALVELDYGAVGLVLLDLNLPDQNGWEVLERITRRSPTVPVILITGLPGQQWAREVACVAPLLEKPLDAAVLLITIQQLLEEPREVRLRRFCAFLENSHRISQVGPASPERMPHYPTTSAISKDTTGGVVDSKP